MSECVCRCHTGGAYPPPCDVPGGCWEHHRPGEDAPTCAASGCTRHPAPILCGTDARVLGDWLAQLGDAYARLTAAPSMQGREPDTGGSGGLTSQRDVGQLHVMALRDPRTPLDHDTRQASVLATLHGWAEMVRDARGLYPAVAEFRVRRDDRHIGPHCADACDHGSCAALTFLVAYRVPPTVATERKLLADHLAWIVQQDWAGDFYDEIRLVWQLVSAGTSGPGIPRPRRACPEVGCGGTVTWTDGAARCGGCGKTWAGLEAARIGAAA